MFKLESHWLHLPAIALIALAAAVVESQEPQPPLPTSGLTWKVSFSGVPNQSDIRAAKMVITSENLRRTGAGETLLPMTEPEELNASYILVMENAIKTTHALYILQEVEQSKPSNMQEWWRNATDEQREAIKAMTKAEPPPQEVESNP